MQCLWKGWSCCIYWDSYNIHWTVNKQGMKWVLVKCWRMQCPRVSLPNQHIIKTPCQEVTFPSKQCLLQSHLREDTGHRTLCSSLSILWASAASVSCHLPHRILPGKVTKIEPLERQVMRNQGSWGRLWRSENMPTLWAFQSEESQASKLKEPWHPFSRILQFTASTSGARPSEKCLHFPRYFVGSSLPFLRYIKVMALYALP